MSSVGLLWAAYFSPSQPAGTFSTTSCSAFRNLPNDSIARRIRRTVTLLLEGARFRVNVFERQRAARPIHRRVNPADQLVTSQDG